MSKRKHPPISIHKTLHGKLEVNWGLDYHQEYNCPYCEDSKITWFKYHKTHFCKLSLKCKSCKKSTFLTCQLSGVGLKHFPISQHPTLNENKILKINWKQEYKGEYICPCCNQSKLTAYRHGDSLLCKLFLKCNHCSKPTYLTCPVPGYISNYCPDIECPNPLCTDIGNNGQKGWVYYTRSKKDYCRCHFCQINFKPYSISKSSWTSTQSEHNLQTFSFKEDVWKLAHFYENPHQKTLNFQELYPIWYRQEVKKYFHYLLESKVFSLEHLVSSQIYIRQLGKTIANLNLENKHSINRKTITIFLETCKENKSATINSKLTCLRKFFDWLDLETFSLIRSRDFLKVSKNDADWLDEVTRRSIKQHLDKIPSPIARQYLVQSYIAARPGDVCHLLINCLITEDGKWYIKFFQGKTQRWHKILASRKIRKIIEAQQQWIRRIFGEEYSYLFCHFRSIKQTSYPSFSNIKPLPEPPKLYGNQNSMVRIIRMLIENENVLDANGQKPHFTGRITRHSRLQEVRTKHGMEAAQLYADHKSSTTTFQHYAPPTREQIAEVDLPFQELLLNTDNKFLPWQSLPESLLKNPKAHELDLEIAPRLVVYGHCALDPKTPCPINLFPKCYGCSSFRPSTGKLALYERQYQGEQQRLTEAEKVGAELAQEEAKATIEAMDKWLPELRRLANG